MGEDIRIPINNPPNLNVDKIEPSARGVQLVDGYVDELRANVRKPGLTSHITLGTNAPVNLFWWEERDIAIAVSNGRIFKITNAAGSFAELTGAGEGLKAGVRPTYAGDGTNLVMANGDFMITTDGTALTSKITDPDAPTNVSHVAFIDGRILANDLNNRGRFNFSDPNSVTAWGNLAFATAETRPDVLLALFVAWREVILFGTRSIENFFNDGSTPFSRLQGAFIERGLGATYSPAFANNTWFFLDSKKHVIQLSGRTPKLIGGLVDREIGKLSTFDDAIGNAIEIEGRYFYVLTFPTEKRTFVYEYRLGYWQEWGFFDKQLTQHEHWLGNDYVFAEGFNQHLVGDRRNTGKIFKLETSANQDDGNEIQMKQLTGWIDHNSSVRKRSNRLTIRTRRGKGSVTAAEPPRLMVRWRDNGAEQFGNFQQFDLGRDGDTEFVGMMHQLGIYRKRQWEFTITDDVPFSLVDVEENVDRLMN